MSRTGAPPACASTVQVSFTKIVKVAQHWDNVKVDGHANVVLDSVAAR
jgi:hypothetical protein